MNRLAVAAAALFLSTFAAAAEQPLEVYSARLGADDHFNSKGDRLSDAAAIVRQDRANFHEFGIRDPEDESDRFFSVKANRARLEALLRAGRMNKYTRNAIIRGTPMVSVEVYTNYIVVTAYQ